jgi:hypothetical protein
MSVNARAVAFYLPQFHPIPENDAFWGKGFTEWTNVTKARPLFRGHVQPHLPSDLGFYDLRVPEVREAQAELARSAGIEAFCYWHYWFGGGKRLLERPLDEVLASGRPDFGFCLAWANESWTGRWHGVDDVICEQRYPGLADIDAHFSHVLPFFRDSRYLRVGGRCVFTIYSPDKLPSPRVFIDRWQELAAKSGLEPLFFVAVSDVARDAEGYDGTVANAPLRDMVMTRPPWYLRPINKWWWTRCGQPYLTRLYERGRRPLVVDYANYISSYPARGLRRNEFPCIVPNWDNTPRCGKRGFLLCDSTPELFAELVERAFASMSETQYDTSEPLLFIKSWNEWAEGNYLEPDQEWGRTYLDRLSDVLVPLDEGC